MVFRALVLSHATMALGASTPDIDTLAQQGHWVERAWPEHSQMLHRSAPSLELSSWINGEVTVSQMRGQIVVVDFWATWCPPCRRSIPHNNGLARKYGSRGVVLFGVCGGGKEESMGDVAKAAGMTYPSAKASPACVKAWKVSYWPTYAIIDRRGDVRAIGVQPEYVEKILDALLQEQPR